MKLLLLIVMFVIIIYRSVSENDEDVKDEFEKIDKYIPSLLNITSNEWKEIKYNFKDPKVRANEIQFSFPGTKWCGPGNSSTDYDDLGLDLKTDMCCRTHDHCNVSVAAGQQYCGLKNEFLFTLSGCDCDNGFLQCLLDVNAVSAATVGALYSSIMSTCIRVRGQQFTETGICVLESVKSKLQDFVELIMVFIRDRYPDHFDFKCLRWKIPMRVFKDN